MFSLIIQLFTKIVYQPFFNLLVLFYEGLERYPHISDMGIAVILFTIAIRVVLLPLSLLSGESEEEKRRVGQEFEEVRRRYQDEPLKLKQAKDALVRKHKRIVRAEIISLSIQMLIAIVLWRIFAHGLKGTDLHLLYSFVPRPDLPFSLYFLGKVDLTKPSLTMNLTSSLLIFLVETLSLNFSVYPATRNDRIMQLVVPLLVFLYLFNMPAGKKLFIITTLVITLLLILAKECRTTLNLWRENKKRSVTSYGKLIS